MLNKIHIFIAAIVLVIATCSCIGGRRGNDTTPWGETLNDTTENTSGGILSMDDIIENGEMIVLTMSGPETYFDYHGHGMGTQYLLCEKFAQHIGVSLRVEVCKDTTEMVDRLKKGEADLIAFMIPKKEAKGLRLCGARIDSLATGWAVKEGNTELAKALDSWYKPQIMAQVKNEEKYLFSAQSIKRHVYAPFLDRASGVISKYDNLFRRYAPMARWDWRLLAAQCYQESCFDPNAKSWAGACGLMQIMPGTADHLGLPHSDLFNPERSIEAAVRYLAELTAKFRDVPSNAERQNFVLASYNGGYNHIKDAMALTRKYGGNPHRWSHVAPYVLKLQSPEYYNDPIVKNGYMRGSETVDYVDRIRQRYAQYGGARYNGPSVSERDFNEAPRPSLSPSGMMPRRATKKYRFHI